MHYVRHDDIPAFTERGWKVANGNLGQPHGEYSVTMEKLPEPRPVIFLSSPQAGEVYLNVGEERYLLSKGQVENLTKDGLHEILRWPV
jgi:hypothetical protein